MDATKPSLLLSIDFEDWHQLVRRAAGCRAVGRAALGVRAPGDRSTRLLDDAGARATFFVLGITASHYPDLVRGSPPPARARLPRLRAPARRHADGRRVPPRSRGERPHARGRSVARGRLATGRPRSRSTATRRGPSTASPSSASATTRACTTRPASAADRGDPDRRLQARLALGARALEFPIAVLARGRPLAADRRRRLLARVPDEPAPARARTCAPVDVVPRPLLPPVRVRSRAAARRAAADSFGAQQRLKALSQQPLPQPRPAQDGKAIGYSGARFPPGHV